MTHLDAIRARLKVGRHAETATTRGDVAWLVETVDSLGKELTVQHKLQHGARCVYKHCMQRDALARLEKPDVDR